MDAEDSLRFIDSNYNISEIVMQPLYELVKDMKRIRKNERNKK